MIRLFLLLAGLAFSRLAAADPCDPQQCITNDLENALADAPVLLRDSPVLSSPMQNVAGRIVFPWDKPGDTIPFELTVEAKGDASRIKAELWTNANHNEDPSKFEAYPMHMVRKEGNCITFRIDLPIQKIGNYRATARVSTNNGRSWNWVGEVGSGDIRFRPHAEEHDRLNIMEVNVSSVNGGHGTLDDLSGSGSPATNRKYTLEYLASIGINGIWVQPPFKRSVWDYRHPMDDAGSPYATKDFFAVDTDISARAREILRRGGTQEEAEAAAIQEWKDFVAKAHALGIKVILDIALNHVGHNYEFADLFTYKDASGKEVREVHKNDFMKIAPDAKHFNLIQERLEDPNIPKYLEYIAPWLYASQSGNPDGATDVSDIRAGGGQWFDTKQLNHGGSYGVPNPEINRNVIDWFGRILEYWAVDMGVDGFRLDHLTGLPETVLEQSLNHAQHAVDEHRPGVHLYVTGEDFFNAEYNASYLDNIQDTWMRNALLHDRSPAAIRGLLSNPYFDDREMLNLTSHDEERFEYNGDMKGAARMNSLLPLLGGTNMFVAGDELGERFPLPFTQPGPVGSIQTPSPAGLAMSEQIGKAGKAKNSIPALSDDNRTFLDPRDGGSDPDLLVLSRNVDSGKEGNPVIVAANMNNSIVRENVYSLDESTFSHLDPNKRYQVRDLLGNDPNADLWSEPMTGHELWEKGLFIRLDPYQVQVLEIHPAP